MQDLNLSLITVSSVARIVRDSVLEIELASVLQPSILRNSTPGNWCTEPIDGVVPLFVARNSLPMPLEIGRNCAAIKIADKFKIGNLLNPRAILVCEKLRNLCPIVYPER